ncbi:hypothetical protein QAD02_011577 [Eretmocerus hayati]|uniref:Uncharacterized protein n=1 Tax=Eretmocerus hayati TaxID=131215 RepID=A0ACC2NYW9_9HYME|nr:hypothetical protein QAD02_011577 [Eretmocerus hayati]
MPVSQKVHKIELRDLQSVLRKKLGNSISVVNYNVEPLLQPGENYGSSIFKVHAIITRGEGKEERLDLVAKMMPATDFQREIFCSSLTFRKEIFLYDTLIPAYKDLEREFGVEEEELFDIVPEFFGSRLSMIPNREIDEDAVILLQNLKAQGYYMADRREGLDLEHAKVAVSNLARFHALGIAMKLHKPSFFEIVKSQATLIEQQEGEWNYVECVKTFQKIFRNDAEISKYQDQIDRGLMQDVVKITNELPPEPWSTIVHADFWINNFMFKNNPLTGKVVSIKFVDFQNFLYLTVTRELAVCLVSNSSADVMENHFNELIDHYYGNFIQILKRMQCDVGQFSRDKFDERLAIDAFKIFPFLPFSIKIMTDDVKRSSNSSDVREVFHNIRVNDQFLQKMRKCVEKFDEMNWFQDREG